MLKIINLILVIIKLYTICSMLLLPISSLNKQKNTNTIIFNLININGSYIDISLNNLLTNMNSFTHPIMLLLYLYILLSLFFKKKINMINKSTTYLVISFVVSIHWSGQELFWNGFFNWDTLEVLLIFLIINDVLIKHTKQKYINFINYRFLTIIIVIVFFIISKSNLISTRHTFSNSFFFKLSFLLYLFFIIPYLIKVFYYFTNCGVFYYKFLILSLIFVFLNYIVNKLLLNVQTSNVKYTNLIIFLFLGLNFKSLLFLLNDNFLIYFNYKTTKKINSTLKHVVIYLLLVLVLRFYLLKKIYVKIFKNLNINYIFVNNLLLKCNNIFSNKKIISYMSLLITNSCFIFKFTLQKIIIQYQYNF